MKAILARRHDIARVLNDDAAPRLTEKQGATDLANGSDDWPKQEAENQSAKEEFAAPSHFFTFFSGNPQ